MIDPYNIIINPTPDSSLWKAWQNLVNEESWTSDDRSVLKLTPAWPTTRSVFAHTPDGDFISCVVWNECDGMSFIGFFLTSPSYRGKGIGSTVWQKAISLMPKDQVIGLRAVPVMEPKYKSMTTPISGLLLEKFILSQQQLLNTCSTMNGTTRTVKIVRELSDDDWGKVIGYDKIATRRDRTTFLKAFYKDLSFTYASAVFDEAKNVVAIAAITPTTKPEKRLYKLGPVYADCFEDALHAIRHVTLQIDDPEATIAVHLLENFAQSPLLREFIVKNSSYYDISGRTLFSATYDNPSNNEKIFVPHNNSCHFDA